MKEIKFYFDFENYKVIFDDGTVCDIDGDQGSFVYKGVKFIMESDVEKDLCYKFKERYVNQDISLINK